MTEMVSITMAEYEEYLQLKKDRDEALEIVDRSLEELKAKKVYDL